ncbi:MAG: hypothetical protein AAB679_00715 [Patescibacteria group bacterium]
MIFDKIQKLQQKPVQTRKKIAFGISAGITIIILIVWLSVFNLNSNNAVVGNSQKVTNKNSDLTSPFSKIKKDFAQIFESAPEKFGNLKNSTTLINSTSSSQITATTTSTDSVSPE